jgi:succinate dehydrogenase / fumarate reductase, cytochrome b subunit
MNAIVAFWRSTIGKKVVMAVTGVIGIGFLISHVASNLLVFQGPEKINEYAVFLRSLGPALLAARVVLVVAVVLHVIVALQLAARKRAARPVGYRKLRPQVTRLWDRTMFVGGLVLLAFIVFHLLHLTWGVVHPSFTHLDPYGNIVRGFREPWVVGVYVLGVLALGMHLAHGAWSSVRTLGVNRSTGQPLRRPIALVLAALLWLGFTIIPLAVLFGVLG